MKKSITLWDSSQALDSDLALQCPVPKKFRNCLLACSLRKIADWLPPSLFGPNRQNLRCHRKEQEGVGGGRDHVLFSDNHEFFLFHLAFNFHQNKVFTKINVGIIKAPDSSTCGYWDWIMLCSNYTLLLLGSVNVLLWAAFCWFKVRWHRDRLAKTTDIINCNLASKDEWERNALICDSELSCSIYRKTCLQGKSQTDRQTGRAWGIEKSLWVLKIIFSQITDDLNEYEGSGRECRDLLAILLSL